MINDSSSKVDYEVKKEDDINDDARAFVILWIEKIRIESYLKRGQDNRQKS